MGRAIRLIIKNIAGQEVNVTCQTTFGSPGRVAGIVFGEWEERSPWAPFAERRGVKGDAVSVYGTMGTRTFSTRPRKSGLEFLEMIGKSLGYPGANGFSPAMPYAEIMVAINPVWARDHPSRRARAGGCAGAASGSMSSLDANYLTTNTANNWRTRTASSTGGSMWPSEPKDVLVVCCGGTGGLHATGFHSFGSCLTQTRAILPGPEHRTALRCR